MKNVKLKSIFYVEFISRPTEVRVRVEILVDRPVLFLSFVDRSTFVTLS